MEEINFISASQVLTIQHTMLQRYGGKSGIMNPHGLASALAQPRASMLGGYLHQSLLEMAQAYYFHLMNNQPFYRHNQKTAFLSAGVFLALNNALPPNLAEIILGL